MAKKQISEDVAVKDLIVFLKKHLTKEFRRGTISDEKIKEDYIDVIESIEDGNLVVDENGTLNYSLYWPLYADAEDKSLVKKEITFKERIKGATRTLLMNGLDPKKDLGTYMVVVISHITGLSKTEVQLLEKEDYEVLNQICSVF